MQLEFSWRDGATLHRELEARSGLRLHLTITDNTSTVLSTAPRARQGAVRLRLHHMFLCASPAVVNALARWLTARGSAPRAAAVIDEFIRENRHQIRQRPNNGRTIRSQGTHFDLWALFEELNREDFDQPVTARITWGRMPAVRPRRSIRFGSYSSEDELIRVHPLLDQAFVPRYFVRYIVFHEMLHALLGIEELASGRRRIHTREFTRRERAYQDYDRALAWQNSRDNLRRLLHSKM